MSETNDFIYDYDNDNDEDGICEDCGWPEDDCHCIDDAEEDF